MVSVSVGGMAVVAALASPKSSSCKNEIVGTLYYMSPEQLQAQGDGRQIDARTELNARAERHVCTLQKIPAA